MPRALLLAALALGCSDRTLYSEGGHDPLLPDRVAITGHLCTDDTTGRTFPAKVLFLVDSSLEMFAANPNGFRFDGGPGSLNGIRQRYRALPHVWFGYIRYSDTAQALPNTPDGARFYRPQDPEVDTAFTQLLLPPTSPRRDVRAALQSAQSFILRDIASGNPGDVLRTRYIVTVLSAGPPDPAYLVEDFQDQVESMASILYERGVLEFKVNTNLLYYGPRTIDRDPGTPGVCPAVGDPPGTSNNYCCYPQSGTATAPCCSPTGTVTGTNEYCGVYCQVTTGSGWNTRDDRARLRLEATSFASGGIFREYPCASAVDFNTDIAQSAVRLVKKDIVAFNRNVRLGPGGSTPDSDGDGLSDAEEDNAGTSPTDWDSDHDGIGDRVEFRAAPQQSPLNPADRPLACSIPPVINERDGDLLNDCEEGMVQSSATIPDTDGDGLPDLVEFMGGTIPTSAEDRLLDFDGDGIPNGQEILEHTNPRSNDNQLRGVEGYRHKVQWTGEEEIGAMEAPGDLQGVTFRDSSRNISPGQAWLRWDPCAQTLEWSDASYPEGERQFVPTPVTITEDGVYKLTASAANGETISMELEIVVAFMPQCGAESEIVARPLLTLSPRNCYDVKISNIKVMQTQPALSWPSGQRPVGANSILVYFTEAPESRLAAPGISKVAEVLVRFACADVNDIDTCRRNPGGPPIGITDTMFVP